MAFGFQLLEIKFCSLIEMIIRILMVSIWQKTTNAMTIWNEAIELPMSGIYIGIFINNSMKNTIFSVHNISFRLLNIYIRHWEEHQLWEFQISRRPHSNPRLSHDFRRQLPIAVLTLHISGIGCIALWRIVHSCNGNC